MSALLRAILEHHIWANETLFAFCETLTNDQLALTVHGTYGPLHKTLVHIAEAEQNYLSGIPGTGIERTLDDEADQLASVSELREVLGQTGNTWRVVVDRWPDDHPIAFTRHGQQEHRSVSFSLVQMLDHGAEHRNHLRTIVSTHGIEPPEIDGWTWDDVR